MATIPEFLPPHAPDADSFGSDVTTRVITAAGSDKHTMRKADGRNSIETALDLNWSMLSASQADDIDAFFTERGGRKPFGYAIPGTGLLKKFVCPEWRVKIVDSIRREISAVFQESFDLRQVAPAGDGFLLEDGDSFAFESGERMLLENTGPYLFTFEDGDGAEFEDGDGFQIDNGPYQIDDPLDLGDGSFLLLEDSDPFAL